jgi:phenylalanyl-tRNA synthetase beta chain
MGGADSEVTESTTTLLLESAYFQPATIRRTSKKLGLTTEASYRFERGADPELPVKALNLACQLIEKVGGGRCVSPAMDVNPTLFQPRKIKIREKRIEQVLGVKIPLPDAAEILEMLDFEIFSLSQDSCECQVPSFRSDVELEDDVVEEVARHYGYDRIPSHYPAPGSSGRYTESEYHDRRLLSVLIGFGFFEAVNYSFSTPSREKLYLGREREMIGIANPLSEMGTHLRTTLVPGLIDSLRYNLNHGNKDVRIFEIGSVYNPTEGGESDEPRHLALAAFGSFYNPFWSKVQDPFGFHHLKGVIEALYLNIGLTVDFQKVEDIPYLHPGVSAEVVKGKRRIGLFGSLHPRLMDQFKFTEPVFLAELSLEEIYGLDLPEPCYIEVGKFPSVERDLSFIIDSMVEFSKIKEAVQALDIAELRDFRLIDLYQGQNLPEDKLSMTVRLKFSDPKRTLTQEEVNDRSEQVFATLQAEFEVLPR